MVVLRNGCAACRTVEVDGRLAEATEDYLRLRHAAKEAHAVSAEEQRQCAEARRKVTHAGREQTARTVVIRVICTIR